jgi:hypothetical protein
MMGIEQAIFQQLVWRLNRFAIKSRNMTLIPQMTERNVNYFLDIEIQDMSSKPI